MVAASKDGGATMGRIWSDPGKQRSSGQQEYKDMPYRSSYKAALDTAVLPSKNPHFYAMKAGMIDSLNTLWSGTADANEAMDSLYGELESNLD